MGIKGPIENERKRRIEPPAFFITFDSISQPGRLTAYKIKTPKFLRGFFVPLLYFIVWNYRATP